MAGARISAPAAGRELEEEVSNRDVAIGAVYATLDRLKAKGLVVATRPDTSDTIASRLRGHAGGRPLAGGDAGEVGAAAVRGEGPPPR